MFDRVVELVRDNPVAVRFAVAFVVDALILKFVGPDAADQVTAAILVVINGAVAVDARRKVTPIK